MAKERLRIVRVPKKALEVPGVHHEDPLSTLPPLEIDRPRPTFLFRFRRNHISMNEQRAIADALDPRLTVGESTYNYRIEIVRHKKGKEKVHQADLGVLAHARMEDRHQRHIDQAAREMNRLTRSAVTKAKADEKVEYEALSRLGGPKTATRGMVMAGIGRGVGNLLNLLEVGLHPLHVRENWRRISGSPEASARRIMQPGSRTLEVAMNGLLSRYRTGVLDPRDYRHGLTQRIVDILESKSAPVEAILSAVQAKYEEANDIAQAIIAINKWTSPDSAESRLVQPTVNPLLWERHGLRGALARGLLKPSLAEKANDRLDYQRDRIMHAMLRELFTTTQPMSQVLLTHRNMLAFTYVSYFDSDPFNLESLNQFLSSRINGMEGALQIGVMRQATELLAKLPMLTEVADKLGIKPSSERLEDRDLRQRLSKPQTIHEYIGAVIEVSERLMHDESLSTLERKQWEFARQNAQDLLVTYNAAQTIKNPKTREQTSA